jgi:hypothetical protein
MRAATRASSKMDGGSDDKNCKKVVKKTAPIITKYKSIISTRGSSPNRGLGKLPTISPQLNVMSGNLVQAKKDVVPVRKHPIKNSEVSSSTAGVSLKGKRKNSESTIVKKLRDISATTVQLLREHIPAGKSLNSAAAAKNKIVAIKEANKQNKTELAKHKQIEIAKRDVAPVRKHPMYTSGKSSSTASAPVKGESKNPVALNPRKSRDISATAVQSRRAMKDEVSVVAGKNIVVLTTMKKAIAAVQMTKKQVKSDQLKDSSGKVQKKNVKVTAAREIEKKSAGMKNVMLGVKSAPVIKQTVSSLPTKKSPKKSVPMLNRTFLKKLKGRPLTSTELKRLKRRPLTAAELKKLGPIIPRKQKPKEFGFKGSEWSGNSDDEGTVTPSQWQTSSLQLFRSIRGQLLVLPLLRLPLLHPRPLPFPPPIPLPLTVGSVDFALLDEDLCYECGLDTSDEANWSKLIICDGKDLDRSEVIVYSMILVFNCRFY